MSLSIVCQFMRRVICSVLCSFVVCVRLQRIMFCTLREDDNQTILLTTDKKRNERGKTWSGDCIIWMFLLRLTTVLKTIDIWNTFCRSQYSFTDKFSPWDQNKAEGFSQTLLGNLKIIHHACILSSWVFQVSFILSFPG